MIYKIEENKGQGVKIKFKDATPLVLVEDIIFLNKLGIFAVVTRGRDITFVIEV